VPPRPTRFNAWLDGLQGTDRRSSIDRKTQCASMRSLVLRALRSGRPAPEANVYFADGVPTLSRGNEHDADIVAASSARLRSLGREDLAGYRCLRLPGRSHPWASTH
jgi:hypothetical protein